MKNKQTKLVDWAERRKFAATYYHKLLLYSTNKHRTYKKVKKFKEKIQETKS